MKLLVIYGPPGVGKLTVADEIARHTGFKVFHNHLSIDCIKPVFDFGTKPFWKLVDLIRMETLAEAARAGQDLIFTFCYAKEKDDQHIEDIIKTIEGHGGEVCFVLLTCDRDELKKRVVAESRAKFAKLNDLEILDGLFKNYDLFSPVPVRESLHIDNTNVPADEAAKQIIERYKLI